MKKTRLAQMLANEQARSGMTEKEIANKYGFSQQGFNVWKKGVAPRNAMFAGIAEFLNITPEQVAELSAEARASSGTTKLPDIGAPIMARGTAGAMAIDKFAGGYALPSVKGTYAARVDGKMIWVNPRIAPIDGNTVLVRNDDTGRIATWPVDLGPQEEAHVVVLAEMV
jgi:transcriptional regulator with XRE-family HTH domain